MDILDDGVCILYMKPCIQTDLETDNIAGSNLHHCVSDGAVQNSSMATISSRYVRGTWP